LPSGASAVFSPTSLSANGTVTMTVSGLSSVQPGSYSIGITGANGIEVETRLKQLKVYSASFQPTVLTTPASAQNSIATTVFFNWNSDVNVETYNLQVSTQSNFSSFIANVNTIETSYLVSGLTPETTYYWRVVPTNRCGSATASSATVNNFRTGIVTCGNTFTATNFTTATIGTTANSIATVPIVVTGGLTIGDINVTIGITHTYIQDMKYYLEGPAAIGSPIITLFEEPCGDNDDINCTVDDAGVNFTCGAIAPSITGTVKPLEYLTNLNNLPADGTWILRVIDAYNGDGGSINAVSLSICNIEQSLSTASNNALSEIKVYPNPAKGILNINLASDIFGESTYVMYDVQGRQVISKKSSNTIEVLNVENLSEGIYILTIENDLGKTTRKVVINK
jgi:subtilisin-like proprotein convertase family protein